MKLIGLRPAGPPVGFVLVVVGDPLENTAIAVGAGKVDLY
jgi:hypothetical protein